MPDSLLEALEIIKQYSQNDETNVFRCGFFCGSTPLSLKSMVHANLCVALKDRRVELSEGMYGDLLGSLLRELTEGVSLDCIIVVIEWEDLDPRLGLRAQAGWLSPYEDMLSSFRSKCALFLRYLKALAERMPVVVSLPSLPLLPLHFSVRRQANDWKAGIKKEIALFAMELVAVSTIRMLDVDILSEEASFFDRYSAESDLAYGFPYTLDFAIIFARHLAALAVPPRPLKGIIVDLDDTLWKGILGEDGAEGVTWDLEHGSHMHGVFQLFLQSLAKTGVLIAVASKNDPVRVEELFKKRSMLLERNAFFPLMAGWEVKSHSVQKILLMWNVHADAVAFVDDSPLEVEEVRKGVPELRCFLFPKQKPGAILKLIFELRDLFGKEFVSHEDALRLESIKHGAEITEQLASSEEGYEDFLREIKPKLTLFNQAGVFDKRAFELINKTNQFNMNGLRCSEHEWKTVVERESGFVFVVSYEDKFGPLGKIAVIAGHCDKKRFVVTHWVMSCRAFGRRIEYCMLAFLFKKLSIEKVCFHYIPTDRNGPFKEFLTTLECSEKNSWDIQRDIFMERAPILYHDVEEEI